MLNERNILYYLWKILKNFINLRGKKFVIVGNLYNIKIENVWAFVQDKFIKIITGNSAKMIPLQWWLLDYV